MAVMDQEHKKEFDLFYQTISPYTIVKGKRILDLCCQWGGHMKYIIDIGADVFGADFMDFRIKPHPNYRFLRSDAQRLAIKSNIFDIVLCINAFEHIADPEKVLLEIHRVLRPGGYAFISFAPVFYSDVGSHMADFIPEPWAHLKYSEQDFKLKLRAAAPGTEYWVQEYQNGLNRRNKAYFKSLFDKYSGHFWSKFKALKKEYWSGVVDELHLEHENFKNLQDKYSREDLLFLGMYLLLKKNH